ncbi:MAG: SDR family NAD(P)-dependent oxidoreductase [Chitinophagaceae bacterium]
MRNAVITGGSQGIGAAVAMRLARQGFALAICARNESDLQKIASEARAAGSPAVYVFSVDLSMPDGASRFAAFVRSHFQQLDILVNNAGLFLPGQLRDEPQLQLMMMLQLNVISAYDLTREMIPLMGNKAHIFNMCSVASLKAYPNGGSYSISKYALLGFSDNLREELKTSGIRVTALCPGATHSRSWEGSGVSEERIMAASDIADTLWSAYTLSANAVVETVIIRPQLGDL